MDFASDEIRCSNVGLAARIGNLSKLKELVEKFKAPIDVRDNRGWFPIHEASYGNHFQCLQFLLDLPECPCLDSRTFDGSTGLFLACQQGNLKVAELLLAHGSDPNLGTLDSMPPLIAAVGAGNLKLIEKLLEAGANVNSKYFNGTSALHEASRLGNTEALSLLLKKGAELKIQDDDGMTPIFISSQYGKSNCLSILLQFCENPTEISNLPTNDGVSPIYICCQEGFADCLKLLIDYGGKIDFLTSDGIHPLVPALKFKRIECVRILLSAGVDKKIIFDSAEDPVFVCAEEKFPEGLELLLQHGFPINRVTNYLNDFAVPIYDYLHPLLIRTKMTPLGCSVAKRNFDCCKIFLDAGADPNFISNTNGNEIYNPFLLAILKRSVPELLDLFLEKNLDLNQISPNSHFEIPDALLVCLHSIFKTQLVKLLRHGLRPSLDFFCNCKNSRGHPPLLQRLKSLMTEKEIYDLVELLVKFSRGLPTCCEMWRTSLPHHYFLLQKNVGPAKLQDLCRLEIRNFFSSGQFSAGNWVKKLGAPPNLHEYLCFADENL